MVSVGYALSIRANRLAQNEIRGIIDISGYEPIHWGQTMDKYDLYNQIARDWFQYQDSLHKDFGAKAINLIAFSGALLAAGAVMLRFSGESINPSTQAFWPFVSLGILFLLTTAGGTSMVWPCGWRHNPTLSDLAGHLHNYQDQNLIEWVGDEYNRSVTKNQSRLKLMAITLRLTLGFLTLQACALAALAYFLL